MNTITHLDIASIIQKMAMEQLNFKLDTFGFMLGNVKPDFHPEFVKIPHFKDQAFDFIKLEIEDLLEYNLDNYKKYPRRFSERLGVVLHYLSDFFCKVHAKEYAGSLLEHYLYEMLLSNYCYRNSEWIRSQKNLKHNIFNPDFKKICEYIENQHIEYSFQKPSFNKDISYAIRVCGVSVISIIEVCKSKQMESVA